MFKKFTKIKYTRTNSMKRTKLRGKECKWKGKTSEWMNKTVMLNKEQNLVAINGIENITWLILVMF